MPEVDTEVLSHVMLSVLDERWKDHLYDLDQLRNAIQYRAWGQKDPLVEYKREAFDMFEDLMHDIQSTFTERFFKTQVSADPPRGEPPMAPARRIPPSPGPRAGVAAAARSDDPDDLFTAPASRVAAPPSISAGISTSNGPIGRATAAVPQVGRNDPCPCGSGRKYKKCHGAGR
jgi:preprotein translocase subunit SecA